MLTSPPPEPNDKANDEQAQRQDNDRQQADDGRGSRRKRHHGRIKFHRNKNRTLLLHERSDDIAKSPDIVSRHDTVRVFRKEKLHGNNDAI